MDRAAAHIFEDNELFFDKLMDILDRECPETPVSVYYWVILGGFSWLQIERDILRDMRAWIQKPVCDEHYQNVNLLCNSKVLFFTFRHLVLWTPLQDID